MKHFLLFFLIIILFTACIRFGISSTQEGILAKVNDRVITSDEIISKIPKGLSPSDSLMRAESVLKKRIIELLMDDVAYQNIGNEKAEIEKLVNEYRRSLIRHRYQERIVYDKVSATIRESDYIAYYEANKGQFILNVNLIKGLFLKVPSAAPGLDNIRKWYRSRTDESLEKIDKYSLQNAIIYDDFYDRWVDFEEVMEKIPRHISSPGQFLKVNDHLEVSDSAYVYLLNISDHLLVGSIAPFEYVKPQVYNMLVNRQKIDYLRMFGEKMYLDAVKNGKVKLITE